MHQQVFVHVLDGLRLDGVSEVGAGRGKAFALQEDVWAGHIKYVD